MKNKFLRLSKEEQKKVIKEFKEADSDKARVYKSITRLNIMGIIGIIYSIGTFIFDFIYNKTQVWSFILDALLLIFCVYFIFESRKIKIKQVNDFLINKDKKSKKK